MKLENGDVVDGTLEVIQDWTNKYEWDSKHDPVHYLVQHRNSKEKYVLVPFDTNDEEELSKYQTCLEILDTSKYVFI